MQIRISKPKEEAVDLVVLPGRELHIPPFELCRIKLLELEASVQKVLEEMPGRPLRA